jgi:hypothetical protein
VRRPTHCPTQAKSSVTTVDVSMMSTAQAAAGPASPASSRLRIAIDATFVSGE